MRAAGCEAWEPSESLAVMGLFEVLRDLPRLLRLLAAAAPAFIAARPDVFVGIDAPGHSIYGWPRRLHRRRHTDRAVREPAGVGVAPGSRARHARPRSTWCCACCRLRSASTTSRAIAAEFVGHPLADADSAGGRPGGGPRARWASTADAEVVALLPGQPARRGDAAGARILRARRAGWPCAGPALQFIAPMASRRARESSPRLLERLAPGVAVHAAGRAGADGADGRQRGAGGLRHGQPGDRCCASGPMVVVYRLGAPTAWLIKRLKLVKSKYFAQPNLLADRRVVGEYFQERHRSGVDRSRTLDVAGRRCPAGILGARVPRDSRGSQAGCQRARRRRPCSRSPAKSALRGWIRRIPGGPYELGGGRCRRGRTRAAGRAGGRRRRDPAAESPDSRASPIPRSLTASRGRGLALAIRAACAVLRHRVGGSAGRSTRSTFSRRPFSPCAARCCPCGAVPTCCWWTAIDCPSSGASGGRWRRVPSSGGDATEEAISAASILAKTARDQYMNQMHAIYPEYDFARHKGYATPVAPAAAGGARAVPPASAQLVAPGAAWDRR